jgi:acyl-CoA synthetase (AMP-forming)/AMP-acid ligase II
MNVTLPIHRWALRRPHSAAVITPRQTLSWAELDHAIWQGAASLHALGLRAGERVAVLIPDPLFHLIATLALARLGVGYFPAGAADSAWTIETLMERIDARCLLRQDGVPPVSDCPQFAIARASFTSGGKVPADLLAAGGDQTWRYVASSGTTGKPKLFALSHALCVQRFARYHAAFPTDPGHVCLVVPPPSFFVAAVLNLHALSSGAVIVLPEPRSRIEDGFELIERAQVNHVFVMPSALSGWLGTPTGARMLERIPVLLASSATVSHALRVQTLAFTEGLRVLYGCSESATLTVAAGRATIATPDTVGFPLPDGAFEIVDEAGRPASEGSVGRIRAKNAAVIPGYLDDAKADRTFLNAGWFYPGDLGCWTANGEVVLKGRVDDMIILDGINIFPAEIENCLAEHPAVLEAVAFGVPSERHGAVPVAAVRLRAEVTSAELVGFARERLGARHPRQVRIVSDFPRNEIGKPLRRAMRERTSEPVAS